MQIDHIALYVDRLEPMRSFYEHYFNATSNDEYHNPRTGLRSYFLSFDNGCRLEIMHRPDMLEVDRSPLRKGYVHLAFRVESRDVVDRLTQTLRADGYSILSEPRVTGDGYYESCIADPEGNPIELCAV